ncbi:MAG: hypothetical protein AB7N91_07890 [Candidatus Tectimicrobiota bacterium]
MRHNPQVLTRTDGHAADTMAPGGHTIASADRRAPMACSMGRGGLKGLLLMTACCAASLLLLLVVPILGTGLGGRIALSVNILAVFACPVGMALMMWMMRGRRAEAPPPIHEQLEKAARRCQDSRPRAGHGLPPQEPAGSPAS